MFVRPRFFLSIQFFRFIQTLNLFFSWTKNKGAAANRTQIFRTENDSNEEKKKISWRAINIEPPPLSSSTAATSFHSLSLFCRRHVCYPQSKMVKENTCVCIMTQDHYVFCRLLPAFIIIIIANGHILLGFCFLSNSSSIYLQHFHWALRLCCCCCCCCNWITTVATKTLKVFFFQNNKMFLVVSVSQWNKVSWTLFSVQILSLFHSKLYPKNFFFFFWNLVFVIYARIFVVIAVLWEIIHIWINPGRIWFFDFEFWFFRK